MANLSNINNKFLVTTGGNVGIGVTSPSSRLQVKDSQDSSFDSGIGIIRSASSQTGYINMVGGAFNFNAPSGIPIRFRDGGTVNVTIDGSGNVGIGTDSPSSFVSNGNKLVVGDGTVSQGITIYTSDDGNGTLYFADGTTGDEAYRGFVRYSHSLDSMLFYTAGANERMRIDSSGNVNVTGRYLSLTDSDYTYILGKRTSPSDGFYLTRLMGYGDNTFYGSFDVLRHDANDGELRMRQLVAGTVTDVMTIVDGNVGIGTTSPSVKLDIVGSDTTGERDVQITGDSSIIGLGIGGDNGPHGLSFGYDSSQTSGMSMYYRTGPEQISFEDSDDDSGNKVMVIGKDGNVGIGTTSPSTKLHVMGTIKLGGYSYIGEDLSDLDSLTIASDHTESIHFAHFTPATGTYSTNMIIDNSGNVGIGTTSPSEILQTNKNSAGNIVGGYFTNSQANTGAESVSLAFGLNRSGGDFVRQVKAITFGAEQQWTGTPSTVDGYLAFSTISNETVSERMRINSNGYIEQGIVGTTGNAYYYFNTSTSGDSGLIFRDNTSTNSGYLTYNHFENAMKFGVNGSEKMRIDSSGNVAIGATSSSSRLKVVGPNTSSNPLVDLVASGTGSFQRGVRLLNGGMNVGDEIMYAVGRSDNTRNMGQMYFHYAGDGSTSNRISMGLHGVDDVFNIAGTGNVGIGTTSPPDKLYVDAGTAAKYAGQFVYGGTDGTKGCLKLRTVASTGPSFIDFFYDGFSTNPLSPVGAIVTTGTATSYASFSDYRMKQNVNDLTNVLDKVINLKPKTFNYKNVPDVEVQGFLAHELQEVIPQAVHGEKDEIHPDGNPKYQLVDHSHMIPLLTAAIKELKADNDSLKARIETLENN